MINLQKWKSTISGAFPVMVTRIQEVKNMLRYSKVLIHDDRPDPPEFLFKVMVNRGYTVGLANDSNEIISMLSDDRYDVVLTNGAYEKVNPDQYMQLKSPSIVIIGIHSHKKVQDMDLKSHICLQRPLLISKLWEVLEDPDQQVAAV